MFHQQARNGLSRRDRTCGGSGATGSLKADTDYDLLLALNGSAAALVVSNRISLAYLRPADRSGRFQYFLNEGMVGINNQGQIDNVIVHASRRKPHWSGRLSSGYPSDQDVFTQLFQAPEGGGWQVKDGRYVGANSADLAS